MKSKQGRTDYELGMFGAIEREDGERHGRKCKSRMWKDMGQSEDHPDQLDKRRNILGDA
jgi:hypothetical protein